MPTKQLNDLTVTVNGEKVNSSKPFSRPRPEDWAAGPDSEKALIRCYLDDASDGSTWAILHGMVAMDPNSMKSLAAWLVRAAEWIEGRQ